MIKLFEYQSSAKHHGKEVLSYGYDVLQKVQSWKYGNEKEIPNVGKWIYDKEYFFSSRYIISFFVCTSLLF